MIEQAELLVGVIATLLTSITGLIVALRTHATTSVIKSDVNNNLTVMTKRVEQLSRLLSSANIEIPLRDNDHQ